MCLRLTGLGGEHKVPGRGGDLFYKLPERRGGGATGGWGTIPSGLWSTFFMLSKGTRYLTHVERGFLSIQCIFKGLVRAYFGLKPDSRANTLLFCKNIQYCGSCVFPVAVPAGLWWKHTGGGNVVQNLGYFWNSIFPWTKHLHVMAWCCWTTWPQAVAYYLGE